MIIFCKFGFCFVIILFSFLFYIDVTLITISAFIGGFIAVFAPGGLGVREGVMVSMLTPHVGLAAAFSISILHRIISILFDLILGLFSLVYNKLDRLKG